MGSFLHPWMLVGLLGLLIPILIHWLNRRKMEVVDWGAMQFLEIGRRSRRRFELTEWLLMVARMALLGLVALALARPLLPPADAVGGSMAEGSRGERRDVVLIVDGSASMGRRGGENGDTPRDRALAYARRLARALPAGGTMGVLVARDRVQRLVEVPTVDRQMLDEVLEDLTPPRGSSDLPAAIAEAFRLLEETSNPVRDVVILTDRQRVPWRPGETARWGLLRDLHRRQQVPPRLWAVTFRPREAEPDAADLAVKPLEVARDLITPGWPVTARAEIHNAGPGSAPRLAEWLVDGRFMTTEMIDPLPSGGKTTLSWRGSLEEPGSHLVTLRLSDDDADPLPSNDEASRPVEVTPAVPVLLVDGEPGTEPLSGETDFLRAALAPSDADVVPVRATVLPLEDFSGESLPNIRVLILANVGQLDSRQTAAVGEFLGRGGGVLIAPGDRSDAEAYNGSLYQEGRGWLPARLGDWKGDLARREVAARPAASTFTGPTLAPLAEADGPPLAEAHLFAYRVLEPAPSAAVLARLDTGDPWIVERSYGKGQVVLLAGPLDAEGGTLPVNPDYVPLMHELITNLADVPARRVIGPGEPLVVPLSPSLKDVVKDLPLTLPDGSTARATVVRAGTRIEARFADTIEPGIYRLGLPDPPGGSAYVAVADDGREADPTPLEAGEVATLAEGWPLAFVDEADADLLLTGEATGRLEIWRGLVIAALGGLCLEVFLTRRLARRRGLTAAPAQITSEAGEPTLPGLAN